MQSRIIRVRPEEQGWALESVDLNIAARRFLTMEAAIAAGWDVARRENAELHILRHNSDVHWRNACRDM